MPNVARDRFDDIPSSPHRVGAHRAENPRPRGWTTFLWALAATIVLVGIGIVASLIGSGRLTLFPAPAPGPSATSEVQPVVDTSYFVLVLNGTPEDGLATQVKDSLLVHGWAEQDVSASNAGDRAFPLTTVFYTAPDAEAAARGLAELVGATVVELDPDYPLPGTPETQLTVVLGTDQLEPLPTPSA